MWRCVWRLLAFVMQATTALALLAGSASADSDVSGSITSDLRWTLAGSPYIVSGQLLIDGGATLTIDAGVTIYMAAAASVVVRNGRILAIGTPTQVSAVRSHKARSGSAAPGDWGLWAFDPGSSGSRLDWVLFEHGQGLRVNGSAPTFNFLDIRNHQGAAITVDLAASPTGVGNQATGNTTNGVLVPAGDITGSVRWGLRGIPYVVASGTLSVGASPRLSSVLPGTIQRGETVTVTATGQRLAGLASASATSSGLTIQVLPGATDTQATLAVTAAGDATLGSLALRLLVDAGELVHPDALLVIPPEPKLTSLSPTEVFANRGDQPLQLVGQNFQQTSVVELDGTPLATTVPSATGAAAVLPNQTTIGNREIRVRTPNALVAGGFQLSNALPLKVVQPAASLSPATVSMFQGNTKVMTLTLPFAAPAGGLEFSLSSSAPLIAGVQATVTVLAGTTSAQFDIRGAGIGAAVVTASRTGWTNVQVPVTVVDPPRRVDFTPIVSPLVGVQIGPVASVAGSTPTYLARPVGILVGTSASSMSPKAAVVGTVVTLTVKGTGLSAVSSVRAVPSEGLTFATPQGSADGRELTVQVTVAADAPKTARRIAFSITGGELVFVNPAESQLLVTSPPPVIESITPQVVIAGAAATTLSLRGINFRDVIGARFEPASGLAVLGSPTANADGTRLDVTVLADAGAASGPRTAIVQTAAGESSSVGTAANTVQVARSVGTRFESIASPLVGVQVGNVAVAPVVSSAMAAPVGVTVGGGVLSMLPKAGTRGQSLSLTLRGNGLQAVTAVSLAPLTGITLGSPVVSADGRELVVRLDIDFNAPDTVREVTLVTAAGRMPFAVPGDNLFKVDLIVGTRFESMASPIVGVQIGPLPSTTISSGPYQALPVGLLVGAAARSLLPDAGVVDTSVTLTVQGEGLSAVTGVAASPSDGLSFGSHSVSADGRQLTVPLAIASNAPKTSRRIQLRTATGEIQFINPAESLFLVTAPVPRVESITPQVVVAGQAATKLTVRGVNFRDIADVRFEPATGLAAVGTPTLNADGTLLEVNVQAAANASSGPRTLILVAAAGESSAVATAANTVQVARSAGTRFASVLSPLVGVQVGPQVSGNTVPNFASAVPAGLIVGPVLTGKLPMGSVKGVSGEWQFTGANLQNLDGVRLIGPDGAVASAATSGVTIGRPVVAADGRSARVPYTVAPSASSRTYRVDGMAGTQPLAHLYLAQASWEVLDEASISSVGPVTLTPGLSVSFVVRGQNLARVTEVVFEPATGIQVSSALTWATDNYGERLTVQLLIAPDAPTTTRVVRLRTAAGLTTDTPTFGNVVSVMP